MVSLGKMLRVKRMIILIHRTIQQVLWIITHELSDPGEEKQRERKEKIKSSTDKMSQSNVVPMLTTRWLYKTMLVKSFVFIHPWKRTTHSLRKVDPLDLHTV